MKTRWMVLIMILLLSLALTPAAAAKGISGMPKWVQVFDPVVMVGPDAGTDSGVEFKGNLYFKFWGGETGDEVWQTKDGRNWSLAWHASDIYPEYTAIGQLNTFKGQLYLVLEDWHEGGHPEKLILRTADGQNWEVVFQIQDSADQGIWYCGGGSFKGMLYIGTCTDTGGIVDARLWRSVSGDPGTWEQVAVFSQWNGIASFASFKGALYVGSEIVVDQNGEWLPAQIWRSFDGATWEPVAVDGFGDPTNINIGGFGHKDTYLYVGMASFDGGDIWRTKDGMNWEPITLNGLGNPSNLAFGFVTYRNKLYTYSSNLDQGIHVYSSKDGENWTLINEPGWGDVRNWTIWREGGRVEFKGKVYFGINGPGGIMMLAKP